MKLSKHIAIVLLNYNSEIDLFRCVSDLLKQKDSNYTLIIVDNAL